MHGRALVASVTLFAFTTLVVWPQGAAAQGAKPGEAAPAASAAPAAPASEDAAMAQAKQHFEAGRNAYNAGDYVNAIREFKAAEQLRPSPILAYNIGLSNEKLGKRRVAVKYYKRYLELQPNASNKAEVDGKIAALEQEIASQPPPAANTQPGGTAPQPGGPQAQGQEQPGDMPPADPNATAGTSQPGYDPYAAPAPAGPPVIVKKRRNLWWVGLIVAGAVVLTITIAVVAYVYTVDSVVYAADRGLTTMQGGGSRIDRHDIGGATLLRF